MITVYLDASALVKRYSPETGTHWLESELFASPVHVLITAEFTIVEVFSALAAKHRAPRGITVEERDEAVADFLGDCAHRYQLIGINRAIIEQAATLTQNHRLRAYDAIHLATALTVNHLLLEQNLLPLTFVAADNDLLIAAEREGMNIENPNEHEHS